MFNLSLRKKFFIVFLFTALAILLFLFIKKNNNDLQASNQQQKKEQNNASQNSSIKKNNVVKTETVIKKKTDNNLKQPQSTDKKPNDYIVDCRNISEQLENLYDNVAFSKEYIIEKLSNSPNKSAQIASLITNIDDKEKRTANLEKAQLLEPNNKIVNWHIALDCINNKQCDANKLAEVLEKDYNNSAIWLNIAITKINGGDMEGAFNALQESTIASEYNDYDGEQLKFFNQAVHEISNTAETSILGVTVLYASMPTLAFEEIINYCKNNIENRSEILHVCTQIALKMRHQGKSLLSTLIGNKVLTDIYEITGDQEALAEAKKFRERYKKWSESDNREKVGILLAFDPELNKQYLNLHKQFGEWKAFELVTEEAIRLSKDKNYNPCNQELNLKNMLLDGV